jgi:hypothetical protein
MNSDSCWKCRHSEGLTIPHYGTQHEKNLIIRHNYPEEQTPIDCRNGPEGLFVVVHGLNPGDGVEFGEPAFKMLQIEGNG